MCQHKQDTDSLGGRSMPREKTICIMLPALDGTWLDTAESESLCQLPEASM
jgi:hypothetical protein